MEPLEAELKGWQLRGIYEDPRLSELLHLYEEIGFSVKTAPVHPSLLPGCSRCLQGDTGRYRVLYTKQIDSIV